VRFSPDFMKDMFKKVPIAIVGMGGIFPGASNIDAFWRNIVNCVNMSRDVPEGRWITASKSMYHPTPMPDKAYSLKACFVDNFSLDLDGLNLDPELIAQLDPLYHFVLHAGRDAFFDCKTANLDKNRMGVILAAIALPTDSSSRFTRKILGPAFESHLFGDASSFSISIEECLAAKVTSFPASLLAKGLDLGGEVILWMQLARHHFTQSNLPVMSFSLSDRMPCLPEEFQDPNACIHKSDSAS
jgi:hypothetical protein